MQFRMKNTKHKFTDEWLKTWKAKIHKPINRCIIMQVIANKCKATATQTESILER